MVDDIENFKMFLGGSEAVKQIEREINSLTNMGLIAVRERIQRDAQNQYEGNRYLAATNWLDSIKNKSS